MAVAAGLHGRPVLSGLASGLAALPHPLYGVYGAVIGLTAALAARSAAVRSGESGWLPALAPIAWGGAVVAVLIGLAW